MGATLPLHGVAILLFVYTWQHFYTDAAYQNKALEGALPVLLWVLAMMASGQLLGGRLVSSVETKVSMLARVTSPLSHPSETYFG